MKPNVYFIGIGGIGMANLARYAMAQGLSVAGYDRTPSALTHALESEGAQITYTDSREEIPGRFRDPADTLVVYTPAVPADSDIRRFYDPERFEVMKRAQLLGALTAPGRSICFAGTHGKTTTSSMAAHLLHETPEGVNAFLGGILRNYNSNLLLSPTAVYSVVEADEYDRSFHWLRPWVGVITSCDPDHLDIYGTEEAYRESFAHFTSLIKPGGALVIHEGLKVTPRLQDGVKMLTYGRERGDYHAVNIRRHDGTVTYDLVTPHGIIPDITPGVPVDINIDNSIAALAALDATGALEPESARRAMASFMGPERRFEFHLKEPGPGGRVLIDDYAHHPDEIRASIHSVKALYPDRRLTVAFQPHLYSRTRDFAPEFAAALSEADEVILLDIYPAREEPIPGVTSRIIYDRLTCKNKELILRENLISTLKKHKFEVLMTLGAGDINLLIDDIIKEVK